MQLSIVSKERCGIHRNYAITEKNRKFIIGLKIESEWEE
jgi:hypothetical protein